MPTGAAGLSTSVIEVQAVAKQFGEIRAVDGVDLAVQEGEVFGLIGHNGAGKSTLMKMMLGLLRPDRGSIRVQGEPVRGPRFRDVRRRIAYLPENVVFYDNLTGLETLRFFAELKGAPTRGCQALLEKVGIAHAAGRPVRGYSKGMRQRLGFAQALLGEPRLLFLDEPTTGLDPGGIREFYQILAELKTRGVTMILSSHNLAEIQERVDRLALMRLGRIQAAGTVQRLREELNLPLHIHIALRPGAEATLRAQLARIPGCALHLNAEQGYIHCDRTQKMAVLAAQGGNVADVYIREPSLEDVFLGYADE
jgi:Cu-processing system ATP-binding protein